MVVRPSTRDQEGFAVRVGDELQSLVAVAISARGLENLGLDSGRTLDLQILVAEHRADELHDDRAVGVGSTQQVDRLHVQWQKASAGDWAAYAADVSNRTRKAPTP